MKTISKLTITLAALVLVNAETWAHGDRVEVNQTTSNAAVYSNPAYSHGIYGYPNPSKQKSAGELQLIYQDTAHGQNIHSYAEIVEANQTTGTLAEVKKKNYPKSNAQTILDDSLEAFANEYKPTQEN